MGAVRKGHDEVIAYLARQGADPDIQEFGQKDGQTDLTLAAVKRIANLLLNAGADPTIKVNSIGDDETAREIAHAMGHTEFVKVMDAWSANH